MVKKTAPRPKPIAAAPHQKTAPVTITATPEKPVTQEASKVPAPQKPEQVTLAAPVMTQTEPALTKTIPAPPSAAPLMPSLPQKPALFPPSDAETLARPTPTPAPAPTIDLPAHMSAAPAGEQARTARPAPTEPINPQPAAPAKEARLERAYMPAGTPRPRASLTEKRKAPSIGGLIHSMQAKPSNTPYYTAAITSVIWLFIGGLLGWLLVGQSLNDVTGYKSIFSSSSVYIMAAAVLVPIALFWFIAQLVTRSHEMKLMASAMTEVAIRLAEPDKMAEQRVASVGQTIRRQVSAMDDAISRAIGRAGELEALVHNEVAALERSYSQNEYIIRNLLGELVNERQAIAHNGQQVKETLQGVGAQVSRQIRSATDGIGEDLSKHSTMSTMKLQQAGENITQTLQAQSTKVTSSAQQASENIAQTLQAQSTKVTSYAQQAGENITRVLKTTNEQTLAIKQKISAELPQLLSKMNAEQVKLGKVIDGANRNLGALDTTLAQRTSEIDSVISKHTADLNKRLVQKVKALDASLAMRTKAIDKTLSSKAGHLDKTFLTHREAIDKSMQEKAGDLDKTLLTHREAIDKSMQEKAGDLDTTLLTHREAIDTTMQEKAAEIDQAIASQAKAMDASLTQKARTIDSALTERLTIIETKNAAEKAAIEQMAAVPPQHMVLDEPEEPTREETAQGKTVQEEQETAPSPASDLSMLRGSEALERAMSSQSENLHSRLEQNSTELEETIKRQNELSPEITELKNKYEQLVKEQVEQATGMIRQFSAQGGELKATAGLLASSDMKMSAMIGPQQDRARAILADLVNRSRELEQNRSSFANALDNSKMLGDETAERLNQLLTNSSSTRAEQEKEKLQQAAEQCQQNTMEAKKWMSDYSHSLSAQVVELVSGMSRSTSRTRVLPGEMANTSTDVGKAVDEQLQALDALASISGAAINAAQASATAAGAGAPFQGQTPGRQSPPPIRARNNPRASIAPRPSAPAGGQAGQAPARNAGQKPSQWSFGDLLARVAETDIDTTDQPLPNYRPATSDTTAQEAANRKPSVALDPLDVLRMDDIARALDAHTAAIAWNRSQTGERNVFSQRLYTPEGQQTFQHITQRYHADDSFRKIVEKYVNDFEGILGEADEKDPSGRIVQNYITSEIGRAYLMLAHISGRLG